MLFESERPTIELAHFGEKRYKSVVVDHTQPTSSTRALVDPAIAGAIAAHPPVPGRL